MKRSEMLNKLQNKLWFDLMHTSEFKISDAKYLAQSLLDYLEREGMKPPFCEDPFDRSLGESSVYVENYKWEREDA